MESVPRVPVNIVWAYAYRKLPAFVVCADWSIGGDAFLRRLAQSNPAPTKPIVST